MADYDGYIPSYDTTIKVGSLDINTVVSYLDTTSLTSSFGSANKILLIDPKLFSSSSNNITIVTLDIKSLLVTTEGIKNKIIVLPEQKEKETFLDAKIPTQLELNIESIFNGIQGNIPVPKSYIRGAEVSKEFKLDANIPIQLKLNIESSFNGIQDKIPVPKSYIRGAEVSKEFKLDANTPTQLELNIESIFNGIQGNIPVPILSDIQGKDENKEPVLDTLLPIPIVSYIQGKDENKEPVLDTLLPIPIVSDIKGADIGKEPVLDTLLPISILSDINETIIGLDTLLPIPILSDINETIIGLDTLLPIPIVSDIQGSIMYNYVDTLLPIPVTSSILTEDNYLDTTISVPIVPFIRGADEGKEPVLDTLLPIPILSDIQGKDENKEPVLDTLLPIPVLSDINETIIGLDTTISVPILSDINETITGLDTLLAIPVVSDIKGNFLYTGIVASINIVPTIDIKNSNFLEITLPTINLLAVTSLSFNISIQDNETVNLSFISSSPVIFTITSTPSNSIKRYDQYVYIPTIESIYPIDSFKVTLKSITTWLNIVNNTLVGYANNIGSYNVELEITDGYSSQTQSFTIEVVEQNIPIIEPIWTLLDNESQITLAILKPYNRVTKQIENLYFGTEGYVSYPTDNPSNISFIGNIKETPKFDHRISAAMDASTDASFGKLVLMNFSGELDNLVLNYSFGYRSIKIYRGNPNDTFSTFKLVLDGVIGRNSMNISATDISFDIYDKRELFNVPVQLNTVKEKIPPVAFGNCFNISGVLIDEVNLIYKLNYTKIRRVKDVRDAGASFTKLKVEGINDYTVNLDRAEVTLQSPPYGEITFDIEGTVTNTGSYPETASDILKYLILNNTSLKESDLDLSSFSYLNSLCPQKLNYYSSDKVTVNDIYTSVFSTVGSFCIPRRSDGKFKCIKFDNPTGIPRMDIDESMIKSDGFSPDRLIAPIESLLLGFKENYTPIDRSSQAKFVYISIKSSIELSKSWYYRILLRNKNILTVYADAVIFDENESGDNGLVPSNFTNYTDALTEGLRRLKLYGFQRMVYKLEGFDSLYPLEIGDIVNIQYKRFGFNNGLLATVIGISESESGITLEVFR